MSENKYRPPYEFCRGCTLPGFLIGRDAEIEHLKDMLKECCHVIEEHMEGEFYCVKEARKLIGDEK